MNIAKEKRTMTKLKIILSDRRDGECQTCFESVIGYEVKFPDGFSAFLCKDCMDKQIDHRKGEDAPAAQS